MIEFFFMQRSVIWHIDKKHPIISHPLSDVSISLRPVFWPYMLKTIKGYDAVKLAIWQIKNISLNDLEIENGFDSISELRGQIRADILPIAPTSESKKRRRCAAANTDLENLLSAPFALQEKLADDPAFKPVIVKTLFTGTANLLRNLVPIFDLSWPHLSPVYKVLRPCEYGCPS